MRAGELTVQLPERRTPELADLIDNFNAMVTTLAQRIERDARFAGDVSHELRSPLTTLSTALAVLDARRDELSPAGRDALVLMTRETQRFARLVDDLLAIARSDAPDDTNTEALRPGQLLLNLLQRPQYRDIRTHIDADALDAVVVGDKRRLEQAFSNILDNAERHGGGASEVAVRHERDRVVFAVDDRGPGVPVADRERVFERFARGQHTARRSGSGTGLGLALVHEHVAFHGGSVRLEDAPGGGNRCVVELPVARDGADERADERADG